MDIDVDLTDGGGGRAVRVASVRQQDVDVLAPAEIRESVRETQDVSLARQPQSPMIQAAPSPAGRRPALRRSAAPTPSGTPSMQDQVDVRTAGSSGLKIGEAVEKVFDPAGDPSLQSTQEREGRRESGSREHGRRHYLRPPFLRSESSARSARIRTIPESASVRSDPTCAEGPWCTCRVGRDLGQIAKDALVIGDAGLGATRCLLRIGALERRAHDLAARSTGPTRARRRS